MPDPKTPEVAETKEGGASLRVLLVEDYWVNKKVAIRMLKKLGIEPETADNGEEAVAALRGQRFDIIFMDCQMPIMDGYEATATIRELEGASDHRTPIIAMTANAMDDDEKRCREAGMDGYIAKPIHVSDLENAIQEHCPDRVTSD